MKDQAEQALDSFFTARNPTAVRPLQQAQALYSQLIEQMRLQGDLSGLIEVMGMAAEVAYLMNSRSSAERLFAELLNLDTCTNEQRLKVQPSCAAFAASKLMLLRRGNADEAGAAAAFASALTKGVTWTSSWQLPPDHLPGLTARPIWKTDDVDLARRLKSESEAIIADFASIEAAVIDNNFSTLNEGDRTSVRWESTPDFHLLEAGTWDEILLKGLRWSDDACKYAHRVCQLLRGDLAVDGAATYRERDLGIPGRVSFLRLKPGASLKPHTSTWNGRLNVHVPVRVPNKCEGTCGGLRVGDQEPVSWSLGQPVVFDDSFVHSAWLPSTAIGARVVLHVSMWHPGVTLADATSPLSGGEL